MLIGKKKSKLEERCQQSLKFKMITWLKCKELQLFSSVIHIFFTLSLPVSDRLSTFRWTWTRGKTICFVCLSYPNLSWCLLDSPRKHSHIEKSSKFAPTLTISAVIFAPADLKEIGGMRFACIAPWRFRYNCKLHYAWCESEHTCLYTCIAIPRNTSRGKFTFRLLEFVFLTYVFDLEDNLGLHGISLMLFEKDSANVLTTLWLWFHRKAIFVMIF